MQVAHQCAVTWPADHMAGGSQRSPGSVGLYMNRSKSCCDYINGQHNDKVDVSLLCNALALAPTFTSHVFIRADDTECEEKSRPRISAALRVSVEQLWVEL